jgi:endonuclease III
MAGRAGATRPGGRPPRLSGAIEALRNLYGRPAPAPRRDPLHWILLENVAYLTDDGRREEAFRLLADTVGLEPGKILAAPRAKLLAVAGKGILAEKTVEKLRSIAAIAVDEFSGNVAGLLARPRREAIAGLKRFPSIGEPAAEKILLFCRAAPILALESNGLRVLLRLGFGKEQKSYAASYRSLREAIAGELPPDGDVLIEAHQLLRRHGQELCRRSHPHCEVCPLRTRCAHAASAVS